MITQNYTMNRKSLYHTTVYQDCNCELEHISKIKPIIEVQGTSDIYHSQILSTSGYVVPNCIFAMQERNYEMLLSGLMMGYLVQPQLQKKNHYYIYFL